MKNHSIKAIVKSTDPSNDFLGLLESACKALAPLGLDFSRKRRISEKVNKSDSSNFLRKKTERKTGVFELESGKRVYWKTSWYRWKASANG